MTPAELAATTIDHYTHHAQSYQAGTLDHDVSQNITALLAAIQSPPPWRVLDFGCGPGRDLRTFTELGHHAVGLDGAAPFVAMARAYSGCEVWQQNFLELDLPAESFDGVYACATLFHVPRTALPQVLAQLHHTLKPDGVLFCSNPHGRDQEGFSGSRYGAYLSLETWRNLLTNAGFVELSHFFRPPGVPRAQQIWLASVWRKKSSDSALAT